MTLLTVHEAAATAGISGTAMRELFNSHAFPIVMPTGPAGRRFVRLEDLRNYLATQIPNQEPELLTLRAAAAVTGISERTMRELFNRRAFPLVRVNARRLYVRRDDLNAYLANCTIPAGGADQ